MESPKQRKGKRKFEAVESKIPEKDKKPFHYYFPSKFLHTCSYFLVSSEETELAVDPQLLDKGSVFSEALKDSECSLIPVPGYTEEAIRFALFVANLDTKVLDKSFLSHAISEMTRDVNFETRLSACEFSFQYDFAESLKFFERVLNPRDKSFTEKEIMKLFCSEKVPSSLVHECENLMSKSPYREEMSKLLAAETCMNAKQTRILSAVTKETKIHETWLLDFVDIIKECNNPGSWKDFFHEKQFQKMPSGKTIKEFMLEAKTENSLHWLVLTNFWTPKKFADILSVLNI